MVLEEEEEDGVGEAGGGEGREGGTHSLANMTVQQSKTV
jgi:hypothetical protein